MTNILLIFVYLNFYYEKQSHLMVYHILNAFLLILQIDNFSLKFFGNAGN